MGRPLWDQELRRKAEEAYRLMVLVRRTGGNQVFGTTKQLREWAERYLKEPEDSGA